MPNVADYDTEEKRRQSLGRLLLTTFRHFVDVNGMPPDFEETLAEVEEAIKAEYGLR